MIRPLAAASFAVLPCAWSSAQDDVAGHLINLNPNGAWSWFEDERAIVDPLRGRLLVGSCANGSGLGGAARAGDIDVAWLDVAAGRFGYFELRDRLQADDHNSPALLLRPDGRYLAMFGTHSGNNLSRWRVGAQPGDATVWTAEAAYAHPSPMSYSNLFHVPATGRTYNFVRAVNWDPNVMTSADLGTSWSGGGKLLTEGGTSDRPYVKYSWDGAARIHFVTTERHPRNFDNSIWHGYVENDQLFDAAGTLLDADVLDGSAVPPSALTQVFAAGTVVGGVPMRRGWTIDLEADAGGVVRALFQMRANGSTSDHRLFFGRFDGAAWTTHEVCRLGGFLYAQEDDYTGLAALHPDRPDTIYVSTKVDPTSGASLARYEIFRATTPDLGASWAFSAVTSNSSVDNLRPIVPAWDATRTALVWFRGSYATYTDHDCAVVGLVDAPEAAVGMLTYHDATLANTTRASGQPAVPTGPATGMGPTDGNWHLRQGFGNGGVVWTSSEPAAEDAPPLRTRVGGLAQVPHDVFVVFWSNPAEDWRVQAGFAPAALRSYQKRGSAALDPAHFVTAPVLTGPTVRCYSAWIGRAVPDTNGNLDVFVDDFPTGSGSARSWYDGLALAPVTAPASTQRVGDGCNGTAALDVSATPQLGVTMQLRVVTAAPASFAAAQFGGGDLVPFPLAVLGYPQCTLLVASIGSMSFGLTDASGQSPTVSVSVPNVPSLVGERFAVQAWTLGALGLALAPTVVLTVGT